MTKVPDSPKFKPTVQNKTIYCFPKGTSEADKQHDIAQVEAFIASVRAKKKVTGLVGDKPLADEGTADKPTPAQQEESK